MRKPLSAKGLRIATVEDGLGPPVGGVSDRSATLLPDVEDVGEKATRGEME